MTAREEVERALDAAEVLAGHAQLHGLVRARRHEDGVEAVVLERGDVVDARVGRDLDADRRDVGDVVVDDVVRAGGTPGCRGGACRPACGAASKILTP